MCESESFLMACFVILYVLKKSTVREVDLREEIRCKPKSDSFRHIKRVLPLNGKHTLKRS